MVVAVSFFIGFVYALAPILTKETFLNKTYGKHIPPAHKCTFENKADLVIYCMSPNNIGTQVDELVKVRLKRLLT